MRLFRASYPRRASRVARVGLTVAAMITLGGCKAAVLDPAGPVGMAERTILFNSLSIMLVIVVPTIVATLGLPGGSAHPTRAQNICRSGIIPARSNS